MIFETIVDHARQNGKYLTFKEGDKERYPHLDLRLEYNPEIDNFTSTDVEHNVGEFLKGDLVIRELMIPSARRLFVKDMLGIPYSGREKLLALEDVANWKAPDFELEEVIPEGLGWNKKVPLYVARVKSRGTFPIGFMAKGTDIAVVDQNDSTFGQEVAHAIYHYDEGISKGSENIEEVHGDPFFVYALQCLESRLARRVRQGNSPHRIKFPDYVCLRAFAGTKIKDGVYHGALGLLAPTMNLAASLVDEDVLVDALFSGSSAKMEGAVDEYLGKGAYDDIFSNYEVFGRLEKVRDRGGQEAVDRMFADPLFKSELSQEEIREIWESPESRNDSLIDRLEP
ncbi:hypothetical protein CMI41_02050 [Candidatus Pacearchaeota archaeon]|nr:hypothetical protein [Candidatus Pacearchaeota archaeon]|tara:strand:+ start:7024 stop:8046 length:1023 start_codon:yes stop_codon:yes gene_type:complete